MSQQKHYPPKHGSQQFHCPHCGVYAKQRWSHLNASGDLYTKRDSMNRLSPCPAINRKKLRYIGLSVTNSAIFWSESVIL